MVKSKNLDVLGPFREHDGGQKNAETQKLQPYRAYKLNGGGVTACSTPLRPSGHPDSHPRKSKKQKRLTEKLTLAQADNLAEAVHFADEVGLTLRAHLTVMWSLTLAYDDPEGERMAKVREGLNKVLHRRGIPGGLTGVWVRECKAQTDIVHDHMLFHLPAGMCTAPALQDLTATISRLVDRHGEGITSRKAVDLKLYLNGADGRYLLKGGGKEVWEKYRIPTGKGWRRMQGTIKGKRCGTTQNIGPSARLRALMAEQGSTGLKQ